ncbi:MAG: hypothetical protein MJ252_15535, partial [archaeon]|nr:hypothetical protein [archaeon]
MGFHSLLHKVMIYALPIYICINYIIDPSLNIKIIPERIKFVLYKLNVPPLIRNTLITFVDSKNFSEFFYWFNHFMILFIWIGILYSTFFVKIIVMLYFSVYLFIMNSPSIFEDNKEYKEPLDALKEATKYAELSNDFWIYLLFIIGSITWSFIKEEKENEIELDDNRNI